MPCPSVINGAIPIYGRRQEPCAPNKFRPSELHPIWPPPHPNPLLGSSRTGFDRFGSLSRVSNESNPLTRPWSVADPPSPCEAPCYTTLVPAHRLPRGSLALSPNPTLLILPTGQASGTPGGPRWRPAAAGDRGRHTCHASEIIAIIELMLRSIIGGTGDA